MKQLLRVLLIEGSEDDAFPVLSGLAGNGYDIVHQRVDTAQAMETALLAHPWDVAISGHSMPRFNAIAALSLLRKLKFDLPFIIVSDNIGEEAAVEAMKAGASDYLTKGQLQRLVPAMERALEWASARKQHRETLIALQESEARFRAIAANIPGMVYQFFKGKDGASLFSYVSEGANLLLGVSAKALQDTPAMFVDLIVPEDRPSYDQSMANSANTLTTLNWEGRIRIGGGNEIKWINVRSSPRRAANDGLLWEGIMANITFSKRAELEIKRSRQELRNLSSHIENVKELERTKISWEIHDDIGGTLTAIKIELAWLANRLTKDQGPLLEKAVSIENLVNRAIETTGRIARDLRPGLLDLGIVPAIEWQAEEFQNRMGISCRFMCANAEINLEPELSVAIFRIFQETLTNIAKHANATEMRVSLHATKECVELEVADNGRGIEEEEKRKPDSFGIRGMLERSSYLGGDVKIEGAPGKGTTVRVRIPRGKPRIDRHSMPDEHGALFYEPLHGAGVTPEKNQSPQPYRIDPDSQKADQ